jgi:NADPH:quinone reductase-like Zn-dependent oxidoreductase
MRSISLVACLVVALSLQAEAAPDKMQAVEVGMNGKLSVQSRPVPRPGPGEVLVHVYAAGVNPVDWKSAPRRVGLVPGIDLAGTIDSLGEGVTGFKVGDAVMGFARRSGSYAEYAAVPVDDLAKKPKSLSFEEAAGTPTAAETAYRALYETGNLKSGQTVLIHGAAGGVGSAAVQIAKAAGARVIGTASSNNHAYLRALGADQVIDYRTQRFEEVAKDVDLVLNTVDAETSNRSVEVVRQGGWLVSIVAPANPLICAAARIHCARPDREKGATNAVMLGHVVELADAGKFKVSVEQTFSMADAGKAWELSRAGHTRGKLVIKVSDGLR